MNVLKIIKRLIFFAFAVTFILSCETAGQIDDFNQDLGTTSLARWVETPLDDEDSLLLSNPSKAIPFEVEFLDESGGSLVQAFTITVSDESNTATLINATSFSANSSGNQGFEGSISLTDIFTVLGTDTSAYAIGDSFDFVTQISRGGDFFPTGNALNAVQNFSLEIQ